MTDTTLATLTPASVFVIEAVTPVMAEHGLALNRLVVLEYGFFPDGGYAQMFANDLNDESHNRYTEFRNQQEISRAAQSQEVETSRLYHEFNETLVARGYEAAAVPAVSPALGRMLSYGEWIIQERITSYEPARMRLNQLAAPDRAKTVALDPEAHHAG